HVARVRDEPVGTGRRRLLRCRCSGPREVPRTATMADARATGGTPVSVMDAPQWLLSAFIRNVLAVGATASREEIRLAGSRLLERWQEPARGFHNVRHLMDVLARVD